MSPEKKNETTPAPELEALKARLAAAEARAEKAEAQAQDSLGLAKSAMAKLEAPAEVGKDLGPPVKIRILEDLLIPGRETPVKAGEIVTVPEQLAVMICRTHSGHFSFAGVRPDGQAVRHQYTRATRVA